MAKLSSSPSSSGTGHGKKKMIKLNSLAEKLQKSLSLTRPGKSASVPEDVKEGHFAVTAMDGTRLVMPLACLSHPTFRRLLQMAAEEYGFDHRGALTLPCSATELHRILADHRRCAAMDDDSSSSSGPTYYNNTNMVWSY